jgi:hypothetical protein
MDSELECSNAAVDIIHRAYRTLYFVSGRYLDESSSGYWLCWLSLLVVLTFSKQLSGQYFQTCCDFLFTLPSGWCDKPILSTHESTDSFKLVMHCVGFRVWFLGLWVLWAESLTFSWNFANPKFKWCNSKRDCYCGHGHRPGSFIFFSNVTETLCLEEEIQGEG